MNYRQFLTTNTNLPTELIDRVLDFWIEYDPKLTTWKRAAKIGDLDTIKLLHKYNVKGCTTDIMNLAAEYGHLNVVIWLHENRTEGCTTEAVTDAVFHGHLDIVIFLLDNRNEGFSDICFFWAYQFGYSEILEYLYKYANKSK